MAPEDATPVQKSNFIKVQVDGMGIGLASAAAPFLPVFLARLGATNFQVGLLTAMPAFTGLFIAIAVGHFLQGRRQIVPWYSGMRFLVVSSYALTGLAPFFVPSEHLVLAVLIIWAVATLPQTFVNVAFSVVMNAVAGPRGRYDLMSRRWTTLGLTSAIAVALIGQVLDHISFPFNYQVAFIGLSLGGLVSYTYSSRIDLPDAEVAPRATGQSLTQRFKGYVELIRSQPAFVSFIAKRFVFLTGSTLAAPLFPLYYVREVNASDAWIGIISTTQTAIMLVGYYVWARQSRKRGSNFVLLCTTFGLVLHPALIALTHRVELIVVYAGLLGIFQAGLDLVFFDELMKTVPPEYSATFVSLAQSLQYLSTVLAPIAGSVLADQIGIAGGLMVSAALRLVGFGLFAWKGKAHPLPARAPVVKVQFKSGESQEG
jgi:MFS family permease